MNRLLADSDAPLVGKLWASNFVKRQPQLRTRYYRKYDYKRARCEDPDAILTFGEHNREVRHRRLRHLQLRRDWFMMGQIATGTIVTSAERHSNTKAKQHGNLEWAQPLGNQFVRLSS